MAPSRATAGQARVTPSALAMAVRTALRRFMPAEDGEFIKRDGAGFVGDAVATTPGYGGVTNGTDTYAVVVDGEELQLLAGEGMVVAVNTVTGAVTLRVGSGSDYATTAGLALVTAADAAAQTALLNVFSSLLKGLVPASGGGTTNFLRADGAWAAPGGGGGSGVAYSVDVDFGASMSTDATETVTGQAWVTSTMLLTAQPFGSTSDHPAADALIEGVTAVVEDVVDGDGFTVRVHSPLGSTGSYRVAVMAMEA